MKSSDIFDFEYLKNYVLTLMPKPPVNYVVTQAQQQREIESLKATIGGRRFFFVVNLENFELEHVYGINRWLGYSENDFTMKWYLEHLVHPGKRKSVILVAKQLYDTLCTGKYQLSMAQRYKNWIALRHYNRHYILANKISSIFQYDANNCMTAYINEFTIIGDYDGQPLGPEIFNDDGSLEPRGAEILQATIQKFLKSGIFTDRQLQIARKMAYESGIRKGQIANEFGVEESTIKELGDRFKDNAEGFFHQKFKKVADAAVFMRKEGLL